MGNFDYLLQTDVQKYISEHLDHNEADLLLTHKKNKEWDMPLILQQIIGKKKAKVKLPSWYLRSDIIYPKRLSLEQCSSEQTARYKAGLCQGKQFIDITAGFGVDCHFISQSFEKGTHCEIDKDLQAIVKHNLKMLRSNVDSFQANGLDFLKDYKGQFDLIYIDPARRNEHLQKVFQLSHCTPNVIEHLDLLIKKGKQVLIKTSPLLDIKNVLTVIPYVKEVHVLSYKNECKEVLYLIHKGTIEKVWIHCVDIEKSHYQFHYDQEEQAPIYGDTLQYLYEPNSSILKAGAYNSLALKFNLIKLHPNSHLYTSSNLLNNFPGRTFKINAVCKYNKKELVKHIPQKKGNITRRNFPFSVAEIRKKTGIKEGGRHYLFATTLKDNKPKIVICSKI